MLHYSTLATTLWVGVTARNIYKQVTRKAKRYEELDEPPPPPRPMLRFDSDTLSPQQTFGKSGAFLSYTLQMIALCNRLNM